MTEQVKPFEHCVVAGSGAWGTALAILLARKGVKVTLWARTPRLADEMQKTRENRPYLPGMPLPNNLKVTSEREIITKADAMLCVIPAQHVRTQLPLLRTASEAASIPIALCSKGIERSTGLLMHEVLKELWPEAKGAVLSGPSFAADVARGQPTAITLADPDPETGRRWQETLATPTFRPYLTNDMLGAELGGAIKNVLAIACGVVDGKGLGESARAALMARGFAECVRFAASRGAKAETLNGLSGLGDIILTCSSRQSRNMSLGVEIGQGKSAAEIIADRRTVAEGAATAPILVDLARQSGVEMPIAEAVSALVSGEMPVNEVIERLLARPLRKEA